VIAERGKTANSVTGSDKENATILFTANAAGEVVTKLILLPYERMPASIVKAVPGDWNIGKTKSGWMTAEAFYEYIGKRIAQMLYRQNIIKLILFGVQICCFVPIIFKPRNCGFGLVLHLQK